MGQQKVVRSLGFDKVLLIVLKLENQNCSSFMNLLDILFIS